LNNHLPAYLTHGLGLQSRVLQKKALTEWMGLLSVRKLICIIWVVTITVGQGGFAAAKSIAPASPTPQP
jgi:hypothetical protein